MIDYDIIQNQELRLLVTASESINSLPSDEIQVMVGKISLLPEDGQKEMIAALQDERMQAQAAMSARGITPEMEMEKVKASTSALAAASRGFYAEVNQAKEESAQKAEGPAENILQSL